MLPTVDDDRSVKVQAVRGASLAFNASIDGFMISATPGIASTLSNSWLSDDIKGLTNPASTFRCSPDNCAIIPLTLSTCVVTSCHLGNAACAEGASVMPASAVRQGR